MSNRYFAEPQVNEQSQPPFFETHNIANNEKEVPKKDVMSVALEEVSSLVRYLAAPFKKVAIKEVIHVISRQMYPSITTHEINLAALGVIRERMEQHYEYSYLAARFLLNDLYEEVLGISLLSSTYEEVVRNNFASYIERGIKVGLLDPALKDFNLDKLAQALEPIRDQDFQYMGFRTLYDRYILRDPEKNLTIFELPQWFWMRVAMGLALKEKDKEVWAIKFYDTLSKKELISSTPTLFNSGTTHSQMSSCFLNLAEDSLSGIFKLYADCAQLSKWAGGIGTSWTNVRATGSLIKGTNGNSQGPIPFLKIYNDTAIAVNQGGKRKGAMCAYMETWHLDIEQFLELKKNTGDERRRTHDINTANWIPDLFMKRVNSDGMWTLFSPADTPDLHDLYGKKFEARYEYYEQQNIKGSRQIKAKDLWRKMITMLYETGHPWITFKDAMNVRNPQSHAGVIHSTNLCTEIALNTSNDETAVCNLASLNVEQMVHDGALDEEKLARTVETGIRMLDNVIDNNLYPTVEAKNANTRHRAIGLGMMGYQDVLFKLGINFDSEENIEFADNLMEMVAYHAILASSKIAKEFGTYSSYKGSKWDQGLLPQDTIDLLEHERGETIELDRSAKKDWTPVREHVKQYGMRNSTVMAIAPTATIANIAGVYPCVEPVYRNVYMKENVSGNFLVMNTFMVDDLIAEGLWSTAMLDQIKLNDGSIQSIKQIPERIRNKYKEVFEIDTRRIIQAAARRAKWIDQSASTNIFVSTTNGAYLSSLYQLAWKSGLKSTYYCRTLGASQVEKTIVTNNFSDEPVAQACGIEDPSCEACE